MPAPPVRQDHVWERRELEDRKHAREQAIQSAKFRREHLARVRAEEEFKQRQRDEAKEDFDHAQEALMLSARNERKNQNRFRAQALAAIDAAKQRTLSEGKVRQVLLLAHETKMAVDLNEIEHWQSIARMRQAAQRQNMSERAEFRRYEQEREREAEERRRAAREEIVQQVQASMQHSRERAAAAERESRRRATTELVVQQRRQTERARMRARIRRNEAERGRERNIHYLNTHGDRLHWNPPVCPARSQLWACHAPCKLILRTCPAFAHSSLNTR